MAEDMEMTHVSGTKEMTAATAMSTKLIITVAVIIGGGLAIGLGVGLGVGLNNVEYITVTVKPESTKKPPVTAVPTVNPETTEPATTNSVEQTTAMPDRGDGPWLNYRLPSDIVPSHYKLTLHPNMTTDDYTGKNEITFKVTQATKYILFHAHSTLKIDESTLNVKDISGTEMKINNQFRWPEYEFYVVVMEDMLVFGQEYVISIDFSNSLVGAIVGIYKATYIDPIDGKEKGIVGSDMEPTDARRGYPCFDEPALKIRYTTVIIHDRKNIALSNMPVKNTVELSNGLSRTEFELSVPMSTYLGCFIVTEFSFIEEKSARGIPLRIYGSQYQMQRNQTQYALKITKIMFDYYENLFGVEYSLPKYDQIAIPNFGTGAMENWGLVTYRETNLLWDPEESSTYNKQRVAAVVAHEMVHQWFGNIVTMEWWDNIWLNEGFASFLEYYGVQEAEPEWRMEGHQVIDDLQSAMRVDSSTGSHPLVVNVSTPSQITEVFDTITYSKGSTILRMMNAILGDDLFFGGLKNYLNEKMFGNANEQDLWTHVQEYVDKNGGGYNVKEIMDPWVQQFGLPVIKVDVDASDTTATVTQEHMLADPDAKNLAASEYNYKWNVKVDFFSETNSNTTAGWLNMTENSLNFNVTGYGEWLKFNDKERGYYRVNYDEDMWSSIVNQLETNQSVFSEIDRCHLLDDGFNLAPAERILYTQALDLTTYLVNETSYFVWDAFATGSSYMRNMLASTEHYDNFKTYYLTRVKPIATELGWNASLGTHEEKRNRPTVLGLALRYGDTDLLANASTLFADWKKGTYIHPDIRQLVYRYGILNGTVEDWEYMLERYVNETVASEKTNLLRGLAATENVELIDRLLEYSKNESIIKEQDFFTCITYISYSENGNEMAWSWVRVNWDYLVDRFGLQDRNFGRLIPNIVTYYNTELKKWEVESFFDTNPDGGAGAGGRTNALLQIDLNIAWLKKNEGSIGGWLADRVDELP